MSCARIEIHEIQRICTLTSGQLKTLLILRLYADAAGVTERSLSALATDLGSSTATVARWIKALVREEFCTKQPGGGRLVSRYTMIYPS